MFTVYLIPVVIGMECINHRSVGDNNDYYCMCSLFVGESGLGKSTLVNTLFLHDLYEERNYPSAKGKYPCVFEFAISVCMFGVAYNLCWFSPVNRPHYADG